MLGRPGAILTTSLAICISSFSPARADIFQVNSVGDEPDAEADGLCLATSGFCTLRAAITESVSAQQSTTILVPSGTYVLGSELLLAGNPFLFYDVLVLGAGSGSTIIDAGGVGRHFVVGGNMLTAFFSGLTLRNGLVAGGSGGSISSSAKLTIADCVIEGNSATSGGGIVGLGGGGELKIVRSTIRGNSASGSGGGIFLEDGSFGASVTATVTDSTISGNEANSGGGIGTESQSTLFLVNSTISGNRSAEDGGGIANAGTTWTYNATIAFNRADDSELQLGGNGGGVFTSGAFNPRNSVIAGNTRSGSPQPDDCFGAVTGFGFNKFGDLDGCTPLVHAGACGGTDTLLGSLAYLDALRSNGGPTATHAITSGSDLRDGVQAPCICQFGEELTVDQRGGERPVGAACDIGAFEYGGLPLGLIFQDGFESANLLAW